MKLDNTSSLFEIFTGFNLLYTFTNNETFASIINERILKPYDKSKEYISILFGEVAFYLMAARELSSQIENSNISHEHKKRLYKDVQDLISTSDKFKTSFEKYYNLEIEKIDKKRKRKEEVIGENFSYLSLFFAFFSLQILFITTSANDLRIYSVLSLFVFSVLILFCILYKETIFKLNFKLNLVFSTMDFNPVLFVFLFRASTWKNFSHLNIIFLYFRVGIACLLIHFYLLHLEIESKDTIILIPLNKILKDYPVLFETILVFFITLLPISHFLYVCIVSLVGNIFSQLKLLIKAHSDKIFSLKLLKREFNRISNEFNNFSNI